MRIRWTESAVRDLTSICDYIEENSGDATARRIAVSIYQGMKFSDNFLNVEEQGESLALANLC